ncbi:MAG TPA: hypothetical protein PLD12_08435 [Bacteroidales bacterium]|nr:hypothetical protein [Bacteroidales bacterium]HOK99150.1 hypothetical protein [Bacteroidales bacterium]
MDIAGIQQHLRQLVNDLERNAHPTLGQLIQNAYFHRHWFTVGEIRRRLQAMLHFIDTPAFFDQYAQLAPISHPCRIAFYAEENIPLEELFTLISLLNLGHEVQYKGVASADKVLRWIMEFLQQQHVFQGKIRFVEEQFQHFDKLILATRFPWPEKSRRMLYQKHDVLEITRYQSVAVIPSLCTDDQLQRLVDDIFCYFGMGCGNVRKIYIPKDFDFDVFFKVAETWYETMFNHHTYMNNYQYYQSIYLMNRIPHLDNGFLLLKEDNQFRSPTGVIYFEYYVDELAIREHLQNATQVYRVYVADPVLPREISFGESVNQLFLPQEDVIAFAR